MKRRTKAARRREMQERGLLGGLVMASFGGDIGTQCFEQQATASSCSNCFGGPRRRRRHQGRL
jgi:hypothetical protein